MKLSGQMIVLVILLFNDCSSQPNQQKIFLGLTERMLLMSSLSTAVVKIPWAHAHIYFPLSECPTGYKPITQPRFSFRRFVSLSGNYGAICFSFNLVEFKGRYFEHHVEFLAKLFQSFLIWLNNIFTKVHPYAPLICTFSWMMYCTCFRFEIIWSKKKKKIWDSQTWWKCERLEEYDDNGGGGS